MHCGCCWKYYSQQSGRGSTEEENNNARHFECCKTIRRDGIKFCRVWVPLNSIFIN